MGIFPTPTVTSPTLPDYLELRYSAGNISYSGSKTETLRNQRSCRVELEPDSLALNILMFWWLIFDPTSKPVHGNRKPEFPSLTPPRQELGDLAALKYI